MAYYTFIWTLDARLNELNQLCLSINNSGIDKKASVINPSSSRFSVDVYFSVETSLPHKFTNYSKFIVSCSSAWRHLKMSSSRKI